MQSRDLIMHHMFLHRWGALKVVATGSKVSGIGLVKPMAMDAARPTFRFPILRLMMMATDIVGIVDLIGDQQRDEPEEGAKNNNPQQRSKKGPSNCHEGSKNATRKKGKEMGPSDVPEILEEQVAR
jgi:hypothetical protein